MEVVRSEGKAIALGLSRVFFWSTVATGFKLGLEVMTVAQLLFVGTVISWLVFLICAAYQRSFYLEKSDRLLAIGLGLLNPCIYYFVLFSAYDLLPAYIAQPLNYTWAITLSLLAIPILKQKLSKNSLLGIVVSYLGVVLLLTTGQATDGGELDLLGIGLAFLSTIFWALYWLLNTRSRSAPTAMMFWSFTAALPILSLVVLGTDGLPQPTMQTLIYGAWVGLFEMGVTFLCWQQALKLTHQVSRISQLIFLSPFLSLILIYVVLNEPIGLGAIVGLLVIVLGVWMNRDANSAS